MKFTKEDIVDLDVPMCLEDTPEGKGIRLSKLRAVVKELKKMSDITSDKCNCSIWIDELFGEVLE